MTLSLPTTGNGCVERALGGSVLGPLLAPNGFAILERPRRCGCEVDGGPRRRHSLPRAGPITDGRSIPAPGRSRTAAPDPRAGPITDGRSIPAPGRSRTAAPDPHAGPITDGRPIPAPGLAHHGPPPHPRAGAITDAALPQATRARAYMRKSAGARELSEHKPSPRAYLDRSSEARQLSRDKPSAGLPCCRARSLPSRQITQRAVPTVPNARQTTVAPGDAPSKGHAGVALPKEWLTATLAALSETAATLARSSGPAHKQLQAELRDRFYSRGRFAMPQLVGFRSGLARKALARRRRTCSCTAISRRHERSSRPSRLRPGSPQR
jgi:hypothetical protein